MLNKILLIVLGVILLLFSICVSIIMCNDNPDKEITYLGEKFEKIEIDSVFTFSSIVKEDFDSLYIFYPYMEVSQISENINMRERERENMFFILGEDSRQAIFFTKNKNIVFRAYISSNTTHFVLDSLGGYKRGFSPDTRFKMTKNNIFGRKQMALSE